MTRIVRTAYRYKRPHREKSHSARDRPGGRHPPRTGAIARARNDDPKPALIVITISLEEERFRRIC
jgi:hypothetical protein